MGNPHWSEEEVGYLKTVLQTSKNYGEAAERLNNRYGKRRTASSLKNKVCALDWPRPSKTFLTNRKAIKSQGPAKNTVRVIVPDSHGNHIDVRARDAFLKDMKALDPDEVVWLGDHLDCGGTFSAHQRSYTNEMAESYEDDCNAANEFLDLSQAAAPKATNYYLEGNHEAHVERWAARNFASQKDAEKLLRAFGPAHVLRLNDRAFRYFKRSEHYMDISIPGAIRLGKCYFVHGICHSRHAAAQHLARFGANVVFGHVHRSQSVIERSVSTDGFGAWCPGTLAKLQPLYKHTAPTEWSHGYGLQFVAPSGNFIHINVPLLGGESLLREVAWRLA